MNLLVKEITKGLLEQERKTIAVYGGGFKPPTKGHFQVVKQALDENQDVDELLIFVGKGERDGVTQEDSMKIWGIYQQYLPFKVKIREATKPPRREQKQPPKMCFAMLILAVRLFITKKL